MYAIKQLTPTETIINAIEYSLSEEIRIILERIAYIAEAAINEQRDKGQQYRSLSKEQLKKVRQKKHTPDFIDDTRNLRNSIGYMLLYDGQEIVANFKSEVSRKIAQNAMNGETKGIVLILTAGMEYAMYVSSRGYDVLDTAEIFCKNKIKEMIDKYNK